MKSPVPGRQRAQRWGKRAEAWCAWMLRLRGYAIVARGLKTPVGELDLIARRGGLLAVVEVKARETFEAAGEAVSSHQRRRIERATEWLLAARPELARLDLRFDVMLVRPWRCPRRLIGAWRVGE
ncbi:MAG: YraN family protein [Proteobacteria bacterium]|nr:YraN family protein [Pseudomonadota bacterium]MBI3498730.1 YraN family protein [Pseudomonadota bacterium]